MVILLFIIFLSSFSVHYFIYLSRGFIPGEYYNLLVSKNWAETGRLSYESAENVVLSVENVVSQGTPTNLGNKLIFFLYGFLFRLFSFQPEIPLYTSFILYSLAAIFIFLIARRIFDWKAGLIIAFLNIVAPFSLPATNKIGHHEWAWLFLVLATFFYFWPKERKTKNLILTGLFLGLSTAAKNSFFVAIPAFLFLEIWEYRRAVKMGFLKAGILFFVFLIFSAPFMFIGGNSYLSQMLGFANNYSPSFSGFGHLFPDAYTFHYDKENFLKNITA
ncbi:MAG: hypothetical protein Athens071424_163, partial [Parcubacteria group bacterium Athens0714_24]